MFFNLVIRHQNQCKEGKKILISVWQHRFLARSVYRTLSCCWACELSETKMDNENEKLVIRIKQEYFHFWFRFICNIYVWSLFLHANWTICQFFRMFIVFNLRYEFEVSTKTSDIRAIYSSHTKLYRKQTKCEWYSASQDPWSICKHRKL